MNKCNQCHCKRTGDDFYKNGRKMKTCDLCRETYHEKRKNKKQCLKCNVFKDKDKFVFRKITYDSCIACLLKAPLHK